MYKHKWNDYQKEIADDKYFYARSCIRQTFFPGSETAFVKMMREEMKKDILDVANQHTCTGIGYHGDIIPFETTSAVVGRLMSLMTEAGYENYVPSCITSFGLIVEITETWHHFPELLEKTREDLYKATKREFNLPKNIAHPSDIIYKFRNELKSKMKYQLVNKETGKPLKGVEHIGCHYAKVFPDRGIGGAEFPVVLSGMIETWGGEVIDYPERRHCCGFGFRNYLVQANRGYSVSNSHKKFESMEPYEPDFIVANCPGCAMFLDKWQYTIAELENKTYDKYGKGIPVLTYEELAGMLLGYNPWELGMQIHQVQCESLLDKIGIEYNTTEKYTGVSGKKIFPPEKPQNLIV
ncbi:MAG: heterodisulfide reductase subunit B [Bacteroidales bacterium]|jgi:heterodisulfide reductase subunit B|nr:heterodisulfide reductase subunit B [Bacteroidales bacterium]